MNDLFNLEDKVIVITGAAGVLAGGTAQYLQRQGARIVYLDLFQEALDRVLEEARAIWCRLAVVDSASNESSRKALL